jgi:hypothetical protein
MTALSRHLAAAGLLFLMHLSLASAADGVFVRFKLEDPAGKPWFVNLAGYIHYDPWQLPGAIVPPGADKDESKRVGPGQFSPWFDIAAHAGSKLHGKQHRAGGIAELPNITLHFNDTSPNIKHALFIELATAPDQTSVVKRLEESFTGDSTSFLVSPSLKQDADSLETASQMTGRRLAWAREATGGKRASPNQLWIETGFWAPQRPELNMQEAEILWLLGFNFAGTLSDEIAQKYPFLQSGGHHWIEFGPALTREDIDKQITGPAQKAKRGPRPTLFGFSDEIACRPPIGKDAAALTHFHSWLKAKNLPPFDFGVASLDEVQPIESPAALMERQKANRAAANRTFTWTTRFRQESANERIKWLTETFHRHAPPDILTSSLLADHPYFGGSGLGMGMERENTTWGGFPLTLDWFGMVRDRVVDVIAIEDWLGLEYMYGPENTWDGFQLIGFQASMMRSGSRGSIPIITWITPSDEKNLRLKSASALCQGSKHFFYWTYGPTATSTENYWSDLRGAYDGIAHITRQLAGAEHIIAPGQSRKTRVALLYSLSSDLWQPFGYLSMAERRLTYFSLIHDQYGVDMLTETDVQQGRLKDYSVLYVTDPCIADAACDSIRKWVQEGGQIYGSCAAGSRNEFGEEHAGLADVFGLKPGATVRVQKGRFDQRGALNALPWMDQVNLTVRGPGFGALGLKVSVAPDKANVTAVFTDGSPAAFENTFGKGTARYIATCPAVSYAKDAHFVPDKLQEKWPSAQRMFINRTARLSKAPRLAGLSQPVVEAGLYDAPAGGTALVLANFAYDPITSLEVRVPLRDTPKKVTSMEKGVLTFTVEPSGDEYKAAGFPVTALCKLPLGWNDILTFE